MNKYINKMKHHMNENLDLYVAYGVGIGAGVLLHRVLIGKPVVVPTDQMIEAWWHGVRASGKHVYLLTDQQAQLWERCWVAAQKAAKEASIKNPDYVHGLAEGARRAAAMGA